MLDREGERVQDVTLIKETGSIIATCELAEESAGGGDLETLRARLAEIRAEDDPIGIDEAEQAAAALEQMISATPRVASPGYLDRDRDRNKTARARAGRDRHIAVRRRYEAWPRGG